MPSADPHRDNLLAIFQTALARVNGRSCVRRHLEVHAQTGPVYLIAIGKPAAAMAQGALDALDGRIADALVVTKHGHAEPFPWPCLTAGHPHPDEASTRAGEALLRFIDRMPADCEVLVLLAGGASALVERLPDGVTLAQWQAVNDWLLGSGLDIHALNYVRKRLSLIKGGRLAQRLAPRRIRCLIISDVRGNDPATVGSGPLAPDPQPVAPPLGLGDAPAFVHDLLAKAPPPPTPDDLAFANVEIAIVATLDDAKQAAAEAACAHGYRPRIAPEFVSGDAVAAGDRLARALAAAPAHSLCVWGGETQVKLPPNPGRGGRCQSVALAAALVLQGRDDVRFLAAGTDGTDGPGEDAGALVDGRTVARGIAAGLRAEIALARADAGSFLAASGDLVRTGPTGTNVMDLMLGLKL
jgi:glycerate 2-kinase